VVDHDWVYGSRGGEFYVNNAGVRIYKKRKEHTTTKLARDKFKHLISLEWFQELKSLLLGLPPETSWLVGGLLTSYLGSKGLLNKELACRLTTLQWGAFLFSQTDTEVGEAAVAAGTFTGVVFCEEGFIDSIAESIGELGGTIQGGLAGILEYLRGLDAPSLPGGGGLPDAGTIGREAGQLGIVELLVAIFGFQPPGVTQDTRTTESALREAGIDGGTA